MKAIIIGGGIHGITAAIALAKRNIDVVILEKNDDILKGTSGSTHNRAHYGYHYPRSAETAKECIKGVEFFNRQYPKSLFYPEECYYLIEKKASKTSSEEFENFCIEMQIPYEIKEPKNSIAYCDKFQCCFKVSEPVFNIKVIKKLFEKEFKKYKIKVLKNSEVKSFKKICPGNYEITYSQNGLTSSCRANIIVNSTYAYSNNILKILDLEEDMTPYYLQTTEILVMKSKIPIPALTVMDGKFISVMPLASADKKENTVLVYDVINSVVNQEKGYFFDDTKKYPSNINKIIEHGKKYFPFMGELKFVKSTWGSRPIPVDSFGDSRATRIISHRKHQGIYSILEGKFISAPLMAEELIDTMIKEKTIN